MSSRKSTQRHERRIPVPPRQRGDNAAPSLLAQPHRPLPIHHRPHQHPPPVPHSFPGAAHGSHFPPRRNHHHHHRFKGLHQSLPPGPSQARPHRVRCDSTQENIRRPFHQQGAAQVAQPNPAPSSDIPGMYFDPVRRKYFRLQPPTNNSIGITNAHLTARTKEQERMMALTRPFGRPAPTSISNSSALAGRELGTKRNISRQERCNDMGVEVGESRFWGMGVMEAEKVEIEGAPGYGMDNCCFLESGGKGGTCLLGVWQARNSHRVLSFEVPCFSSLSRSDNCCFLESGGKGGTCLLGVWQARNSHRVLSFEVEVDGGKATENSHGLAVRRSSELERTKDRIVDLCLAPVDSCVTCVLYVSMPSTPNTPYRISMAPVLELTSVDDSDILDSPVYNIDWRMARDISSVAWNAHKMRMGLGMGEGYGLIVDVVSETDFRLSTRHQRVWAQEFSRDGDLVFLGCNAGRLLCADLRLSAHHTAYDLDHKGVHWMRLLSKQPHHLLAASLDGNLALWDLRMRKPIRHYPGHINTRSRVSMSVEEEEGVIVSGGEDGTTRAWSLDSGRLLAAVPCPVPGPGIVPRAAYRSGWAGVPGAAALILAIRDAFYTYNLKT